MERTVQFLAIRARMLPGNFFFFEFLDSTCTHKWFSNGGLARRHAVALKIEKPGAKCCLGGIASSGWFENHQIQSFSREKLFELCKKNAPVFEVLAMDTLPRDSASPEEGGAVANRLRRRTSDQMVLGSNPALAAALSPRARLFTPIVPRRSLHISFY